MLYNAYTKTDIHIGTLWNFKDQKEWGSIYFLIQWTWCIILSTITTDLSELKINSFNLPVPVKYLASSIHPNKRIQQFLKIGCEKHFNTITWQKACEKHFYL